MSQKTKPEIKVSEWAALVGGYQTIPEGFKTSKEIGDETGMCRNTVKFRMEKSVKAGKVEQMVGFVKGHHTTLYRIIK